MITREEFELAAKAAGYTFDGQTLRNPNSDFEYDGWNPVTDDGDALRLSVALCIDVLHRFVGGQRVEALAPGGPVKTEYCDSETRAAATRLAVFRAAVEIGRGMK